MKFLKLINAHPHPNPLPRGEGTAVAHFIFHKSFSSRWQRSVCQIAGSVSPSPRFAESAEQNGEQRQRTWRVRCLFHYLWVQGKEGRHH